MKGWGAVAAAMLATANGHAQETVGDPVASRSGEAREHYESGDYEEALRLYRDALLERPESPELRFNIGDALFKLGDYDGALSEYQAALAGEDPSLRSDTFYNLGNVLFQQQQFDNHKTWWKLCNDAMVKATRD